MMTFYGQVKGMGRTNATRTGSRESHIRSSVQSKRKSIIAEMYYGNEDELRIAVEVANGTSFHGTEVFDGTVDEFVEKLEG